MKRTLFFLMFLLSAVSCGNPSSEKPDKLIDENKMADILYDISLLEGIRQRSPATPVSSDYIYKKYSIDSIQFAQNNRYYASDLKKYQKIYQKVNDRIEAEKKKNDSVLSRSGSLKSVAPPPLPSDVPVVQ